MISIGNNENMIIDILMYKIEILIGMVRYIVWIDILIDMNIGIWLEYNIRIKDSIIVMIK